MARKKKRRKKRAFTVPIAPIAGFLAAPALRSAITDAMSGNFDGAIKNLGLTVGIGFWDNQFHIEKLLENTTPMVIGVLVHKYVGGKLGLNRALGQAGVPVIRL